MQKISAFATKYLVKTFNFNQLFQKNIFAASNKKYIGLIPICQNQIIKTKGCCLQTLKNCNLKLIPSDSVSID